MVERLGPYLLGPNDTPENGIYTGDSRELARAIPDESVDLIFTDPVYQNIDDYRWLAETGARVLKPDSACLVFCGIGYLPNTLASLQEGGLTYRWTFGAVRPKGFPSSRFFPKGFSNWQCCLWFEKGQSSPVLTISDITFSDNGKRMTYHETWSKNITPYAHWLMRFTNGVSVIFDPFTGGGTVPAVCKMLGRNYLAFEIEPDTAELARERVRQTQPPLFVPAPEQAEFELKSTYAGSGTAGRVTSGTAASLSGSCGGYSCRW